MRKQKQFQANITEISQRLSTHVEALSTVSLRELLRQLGPEIKKGLSRGMTYKDVAIWLKNQGIECSPFTIRRYLRPGGGSKKPTKKRNASNAERTCSSSSVPLPRGFKTINDEDL